MPRLRLYAFGPDVTLQGELVGALERIGPGRLLDVLFVLRDPASGEVQAIDLATGLADGTFAALLDFRLDPGSRQAATDRVRASAPPGEPSAVDALGAALQPAAAVLAVLAVADAADTELDDAVARAGGRLAAEQKAAGTRIAALAQPLQSTLANVSL
jgi:hypothetical protein